MLKLNCRRALAIGLLALAGPASAAKWVEVKSPNFTVYSDAGAKEAGRIAFQFEQVRVVFQALWPEARTQSPRPIVILATRDEGGLKKLLPEYWERKDSVRPAGYSASGADKYYLALRADTADEFQQSHNPYYLLYKVYLRVLFDLNLSHMPPWLSRGLAEFFGATIVEADRIVVAKPLRWQLERLRERALWPLSRLFAAAPGAPELEHETSSQLFDAQAWALVHMLYTDPSGVGPKRLGSLLRLLARGVAPAQAQREALGEVELLDKQLQTYVRRVAFQYGRLKLDARLKAADFPVRDVGPVELLAVTGDFHAHRRAYALARPLLEQAAQQDPQSARAQEGLGYLAWREKSLAEARPFFKRAVELDATSFLASYLLGWSLLNDGTPEALAQAEALLRKAVELNAEYAPAHAALASVIGQRDGDLERALGLARRAVSLEPAEPDHRVTLSWLLDKAGQRTEALAEARRAAAVARDEGERTRAREWLEQLGRAAAPAHSQATRVTPSRRAPAEQEQACNAGQLAECAALGDRHASGDEVTTDAARARTLYEKACDGGLAVACESLAVAHLAGTLGPQDNAAGARALGRACEAGALRTCVHAGLALVRVPGAGNEAKGVSYLRQGCEGNDPGACGALGLEHLNGRVVPRDPRRAAALLEQACEGADVASCVNLAALYEAGVGVAKSAARARTLYAEACAKGDPQACAKSQTAGPK